MELIDDWIDRYVLRVWRRENETKTRIGSPVENKFIVVEVRIHSGEKRWYSGESI